MFSLSKLKTEQGINSKKKDKQNLKEKNERSVKEISLYTNRTIDKTHNKNVEKMHPSESNFIDDIYVLNYRRESAFFTQNSDDCSDIVSGINFTLQKTQQRSLCFPMLELAIEGCTAEKISQNVVHWTTTLTNIFMTSPSKQEREAVCSLIIKIISKLHATQETNQFMTLMLNHIIGKSIDEESIMNDVYLLLKVKILKEFLINLPSLCGPHKAKFDKYFTLVSSHKNAIIQQIAAECLALVPRAGGSGSSGQAHQDGWSATFDRVSTELKDIISNFEKELTERSSGKTYFSIVHKASGLVKTLIALLTQPTVKHFESRRIFDSIDQMLNIKMISGPAKPYILQLHRLAFSILEVLLSRYCELLASNANIIFSHMNQVLRDTARKTSDEKPKFCLLRRSIYACLRLCFLHSIFPFSMTSLTSVIRSTLGDCIHPVSIENSGTSIASKMKLSVSSKEAYVKKKKGKNQSLDVVLDDSPRSEVGFNEDEAGMCAAAIDALICFVSSDSKLLHLSVITEDKSIYPLVAGDESKQEMIMKSMLTPIWKFIIPQVRKLIGPWNVDPWTTGCSLGVYNSLEVKKRLYRLLGSLVGVPFLRGTEAFNAACQLIRAGSCSQSDAEVQQICKQTLQWLSFSVDCVRHEKATPSSSLLFRAGEMEVDLLPVQMEDEGTKEQPEVCLPTFNEVLVQADLNRVLEERVDASKDDPDNDDDGDVDEEEEEEEEVVAEEEDDEMCEDLKDDEITDGTDAGDKTGAEEMCFTEIIKTNDPSQNEEEHSTTKLSSEDNKDEHQITHSEVNLPKSPLKRKMGEVDTSEKTKRFKVDENSSTRLEMKDEPKNMKSLSSNEKKEFYENADMDLIKLEFNPTWK